jgi:hypothetical protein
MKYSKFVSTKNIKIISLPLLNTPIWESKIKARHNLKNRQDDASVTLTTRKMSTVTYH